MKALTCFAFASLLLSGCATTPVEFEAVREGFKGSPALRKEGIAACARDMKLTPDDRRIAAALMNLTSESDVEKTACSRIMAGIVSGAVTREEFDARPVRLTPRLVRVLQNR